MADSDMSNSDLEKKFQAAWNKTHAPIIDMTIKKKPNAWEESSFITKLIAVLLLSFVFPWAILFFGLLSLVIYDAIT